jgi:hypothetical protein
MPAHKKPTDSARSETVTVRLDPKLHYLATIAGRDQVRTLSSFIEWSVRRTLTDAEAMKNEPNPGYWPAPTPPLWMEEQLWDTDEADRFFRLATKRRDLLTIAEQRLWKLFTMHMSHTKQKLTVEAFQEFWNSPSINTSHLQEGKE